MLAARTESDPSDQVRARFQLPDGVAVSGRWKDLDTSTWKVEAPWGQEMKLPAAEVADVRFRGGRMTYLSDLQPSKVEEIPYFGRKLGWRATSTCWASRSRWAARRIRAASRCTRARS